MITGINESKILKKHLSCKCKCKPDGRKCNSNQKWNSNKCRCECEKHNVSVKKYIWNPITCSFKNDKYLANIMDDSVIKCDKIIDAKVKSYEEAIKTILTNLNKKINF